MHQITPSTIEELSAVAGLPIETGRHAMLAAVVQQLLDGVHALDTLTLDETEPALVFDPRWEA
jgi:hypothetical protein